jgi:hypothetical protein
METPPHPMRLGETERDYYGLGSAGVATPKAGMAEDTPEGSASVPSRDEMAAAAAAPDAAGGADSPGGWSGEPAVDTAADWTPGERAAGPGDDRPEERQ